MSLFGVEVEGAMGEQIGAVAALVSVLGWAPQAQHTTQPPLTSAMYLCQLREWGVCTAVWVSCVITIG